MAYSRQERTGIRKTKETSEFKSFLNSFLADILLFTAALVTIMITLVIIFNYVRTIKIKSFCNKHSDAMH